MFDIGWDELLLIGLVALIVIGPKDLPGVLRTLGQWTARARAMAREFQSHVDDMIRESNMEEMKKDFDGVMRPEIKSIEDDLMAGIPAKPLTPPPPPASGAIEQAEAPDMAPKMDAPKADAPNNATPSSTAA